MPRWVISILIFSMICLTSCAAHLPVAQTPIASQPDQIQQSDPPKIEISTFEAPHKTIASIQHVYCWKSEACPEYKFIPKEEDVPITTVDPGQLVRIHFPSGDKPSSIQVFLKSISQRIYATDEVAFSAPIQNGTYLYSVMVTWKEEGKTGVIEYFFRLKVPPYQ